MGVSIIMKIEVARIHKLDGAGAIKAFADITIEDSINILGLRVVEGKDGLFVTMPMEEGKDGKSPITEAQERVLGRGKIESANIARALLAKPWASSPETHGAVPPPAQTCRHWRDDPETYTPTRVTRLLPTTATISSCPPRAST